MGHLLRVLSRGLLFIALAAISAPLIQAQGPADLNANSETSTDAAKPTPSPLPDSPHTAATTSDNWQGTVSIYGWFPGMHGTVGAFGHDTSVHMPFSDLFHYLKGVIPIAVEADKGRLVIPLDFFWVKLGDDKDLPFTDPNQTYVRLNMTQSIFTPKLGYRILDKDRLKIDLLGGIRYWYVGQDLSLQPSGYHRSDSASWVDGVGGARFIVPLGSKASIWIAGDAGAGGASLDYQAVGLFTYSLTRRLGLGLGWRYLDVNYRGNHQFIYDTAQTGALAGVYFNWGTKPPAPLSSSCTVSPTQVNAGEPVSATISTANFNPKHTVTYRWSAPGARISGSGTTASVDTAGLAPGNYTVTGTATDEKEKKNNSTICNATFAVLQPPQHPPVASCSANPSTVKAGGSSTISVNASSPDGAGLSYAYSSTGGSIAGSGNTATLDTTSAQPGSAITATATVTDTRGLTASCTAIVNVLTPPATVQQVQEVAECKFVNPAKPARVDNECKAVLDDLALRIQREPNGKFVIVGYTDEQESVTATQLGAQRAVNVKYYLVEGEGRQGVDPSRLEARTGVIKDKSAKVYLVPPGAQFQEASTPVDESKIKPQSRTAPAPSHKNKAAAP